MHRNRYPERICLHHYIAERETYHKRKRHLVKIAVHKSENNRRHKYGEAVAVFSQYSHYKTAAGKLLHKRRNHRRSKERKQKTENSAWIFSVINIIVYAETAEKISGVRIGDIRKSAERQSYKEHRKPVAFFRLSERHSFAYAYPVCLKNNYKRQREHQRRYYYLHNLHYRRIGYNFKRSVVIDSEPAHNKEIRRCPEKRYSHKNKHRKPRDKRGFSYALFFLKGFGRKPVRQIAHIFLIYVPSLLIIIIFITRE